MILFDFQQNAFEQLREFITLEDKTEITFKSPTGSGKTVILSSLINKIFADFKEYAFIWLTPGQGDLEEQSKASFSKNFPQITAKNVEELIVSGLDNNEIAFINWEKLNKKGNNALKKAERLNFGEQLEKTREKGIKIIVIIDESHKNYTEKANHILDSIKPYKIIRASATPKNKSDKDSIIITDEEVIEEGLIKKFISINEGIKNDTIYGNETTFLVGKALEKREEIKSHFISHNVYINPLVVIQLPNAGKGEIIMNDIIEFLYGKNITTDNSKLAIWLSDKKVNLENINDFTSPVEFIIIKQAIATGRDCPRAHILVKLRDKQDEDFEIQTIGRIRRMPELKHYNDDVLDKCYLYTFDQKYSRGVKELVPGSGSQKSVHIKPKYLDKIPPLIKEDKDELNTSPDERKIFRIIWNYYIDEFKLGSDKEVNFRLLKNNGFVFTNEVNRAILEGEIKAMVKSNIKDLGTVNVKNVLNEKSLISQKNLYLEIISKITSVSSETLEKIINKLFGKLYSFIKLNKIEKLYFIINNYNLIATSFSNAIYKSISKGLELTTTKKITYFAPSSDIVKFKTNQTDGEYIENNAYAEYPSNPSRDSETETWFEHYLEFNKEVEWYYKNGDKGPQYFSVIYTNNLGIEKRFYPDFIFKHGEDIWIVETKGSLKNDDGKTEDIDKASYLKFDALNEYGKKYNVHTAFIRYNPTNKRYMICQNRYSDDGNDGNWEIVEKVL